jgi:hypothetical protein
VIVTEIEPLALTLADDPARPKGVHISAVIADLCRRLEPGRYDKHDRDGKPIPMDVAKVSAGVAFEQGLERFLALKLFPAMFRPPPFQVDGIWMSPDAVLPEHGGCPAEFKLTWYSAKKSCPEDPVFKPWMWQLQSYCKGLGVTRGLLVPQFINGDYRPPRPMSPRRIWIEWDQREIDETWNFLVSHAKAQGWL